MCQAENGTVAAPTQPGKQPEGVVSNVHIEAVKDQENLPVDANPINASISRPSVASGTGIAGVDYISKEINLATIKTAATCSKTHD